MKKICSILLVLIVTLGISGCSKKITTYEELTFDEFKTKIEKKESFPLVVGSQNCSYCTKYKTTMEKFIEDYQITVYYVDVAKFTTEESAKFSTIVNFNSTPTTVFINDGEETSTYNRIIGAATYTKVIEKFKTNEYIK